MSGTPSPSTASTARASGPARASRASKVSRTPRFRPRARRALVALHVVFAVGLLGSDAGVLALVVAGWRRAATAAAVYPAALLLGDWLLLPLALLSLATGVLLGLGTQWGLFRYWWVAISLVVNTGGTLLAWFALLPGLRGAAHAAAAGQAVADPGGVVRASASACAVLTATVFLSYLKPLGRIRRPVTRVTSDG